MKTAYVVPKPGMRVQWECYFARTGTKDLFNCDVRVAQGKAESDIAMDVAAVLDLEARACAERL